MALLKANTVIPQTDIVNAPGVRSTESVKKNVQPRLKDARMSHDSKCLEVSQRYLDALGKTETVHFTLIPESQAATANGNKPYPLTGTLTQHWSELQSRNNEGYGVFVVVNDGGTKDAEIVSVNAVFTDYDSKAGTPQPVYAVPPSFTVQTSKGNNHAYWLAEDVKPSDFKAMQQALASRYGTDPKVCNTARVMRLPGFNHCKAAPQMVTLTANTGGTYDREALARLSASERVEVPSNVPIGFGLRVYADRFKALQDGEVNASINRIAFEMASENVATYDECEAVAIEALTERGTTWTQRERDTFHRGFSAGSVKPAIAAKQLQQRQREMLHREYAHRIRTNELTGVTEMLNESDAWQPMTTFKRFYLDAGKALSMTLGRDFVCDVMEEIALMHSYHPVRDRIQTAVETHGDKARAKLHTLATDYFGCDEDVENLYALKMLLGLVARIRYPGVLVDTMLVFVGAQGLGKTSIMKALAFDRHYYTYSTQTKEKDATLYLHRCIIAGFDEVQVTYNGRGQEEIKQMLSATHDTIRVPYGKATDIADFPRGFVFIASSNKTEVALDETGSRRLFPLNVKRQMDVEGFRRDRDELFAAASVLLGELLDGRDPFTLPRSAAAWWLTADEQEEQAERNKDFKQEDAITSHVLNASRELLRDCNEFTSTELFQGLTQIEMLSDLRLSKPQDVRRVNAILTAHGYEQKKVRHLGGNPTRCWVAAEVAPAIEATEEVTAPRKYKEGDTVFYNTFKATFKGYGVLYKPDGTDEELCNVKLFTGSVESCKEHELSHSLIGNVM